MKENSGNLELLNYIYQNASMGFETIEYILDSDIDEDIVDELKREKKTYERIGKDAQALLFAKGGEEKDNTVMQKVETYFAVKMSTLKDDKSTHIAEMMIQGNNMGIIDITKNLTKYEGKIDKDVEGLANSLLQFQENSVQALKEYL